MCARRGKFRQKFGQRHIDPSSEANQRYGAKESSQSPPSSLLRDKNSQTRSHESPSQEPEASNASTLRLENPRLHSIASEDILAEFKRQATPASAAQRQSQILVGEDAPTAATTTSVSARRLLRGVSSSTSIATLGFGDAVC